MARLLQSYDDKFHWVCDNEKKTGKDIYGVKLQHCDDVQNITDAQIMIVVTSPAGKKQIRELLMSWNKKPVQDFWFFV